MKQRLVCEDAEAKQGACQSIELYKKFARSNQFGQNGKL